MNIQLAIGLAPDSGHDMHALLESLGLLLTPLTGTVTPQDYACIYSATPSDYQKYMHDGGIVITASAEAIPGIASATSIETPFSVRDLGWLHDSNPDDCSSALRFQYAAIGNGGLLTLPAELLEKWRDTRLGHKIFSAGTDSMSPATEVTTLMDKGNIQRTLLLAFQHAHHRRGLPLLIKNRYPNGMGNVFCYRFDCDGGDADDVAAVVKRFRDDIPFQAYFLNVATYTARPDLIRMIENAGGAVDSHSYIHTVFSDPDLERRNILLAHQWIAKHATSPPRGFVCPGSGYNSAMIDQLETLGYRHYASFGRDYDTLPYRLTPNGRMWNMAFHPASLGRLLRGLGTFDETTVTAYYRGAIQKRIERSEPLFFYCHPEGRIAKYPGVYETIRDISLASSSVQPVSLTAYTDYLEARATFQAEAYFDTHERTVTLPDPKAWQQAGIHPCLVGSTHTPLPIQSNHSLPDHGWESLTFTCGTGDALSMPVDQAVRQAEAVTRGNAHDDWRLAMRVRFPRATRFLEKHLKGRDL